ncbi:MAG: hypothetical protein D6731_07220 [Planctomycetota bacterium]|nr:MAG: hypothetical protein D6731_07220 [Planctomycetota bacterium]
MSEAPAPPRPRGRSCGCGLPLFFLGLLVFAVARELPWGEALRSPRPLPPGHAGLREIGAAEALFREADKDRDGRLDYATLQELGALGLVDPALASGTRAGYRFRVEPSPRAPERRWFATASPLDPGSDPRYYATSDDGWIYVSSAPIPFDAETCRVPAGVLRLAE